jgi:AcrR family transcriptional regulator
LSTRAEIGRRKRERTRKLLVEAAMRAFARLGPDSAAIDDVIAEAGVSHGTFYNYFETRDELFSTVAADISDQLLCAMAPHRKLVDPADRVSCAIRTFIRLAAADPIRAGVVVRIALIAAPLGEQMTAQMMQDIEQGLASGRFRKCSPQAAADTILGLGLMGMRSVLRGDAGLAHAEQIAEMALAALGVPEAVEISNRPLDEQAVAERARIERQKGKSTKK